MWERNPAKARAWRELIDAWQHSGQSINAFCRRRRLTRSNFDRWRRILSTEPSPSKPSPSSAFVPLRVTADPMAEVVLGSGIVIRLPLSATPEAVTRLVAAVGAAAC
jgi:hypothetical protein